MLPSLQVRVGVTLAISTEWRKKGFLQSKNQIIRTGSAFINSRQTVVA